MSNRVKVRIFGQEFIIRSEKEEDKVNEIVDYVNSIAKDISQSINVSEIPGSLQMLTALNIAEDYFDEKEKNERLCAENMTLKENCNNYLAMWEEAKVNFAKQREERKAQEAEQLNAKETSDDEIKELLAKCKEFENAYFEAQMEIMHLKDELKGK